LAKSISEESARINADGAMAADISSHTASISALDNNKFNKSGGSVSGEVVLDSYLNFGPNWRVKASADGSKILFQHKKADGIYRTALPFICSM